MPTGKQAKVDGMAQIANAQDHMACRKCGRPLARYTHPDGTQEWGHSLLWEQHDHDPEPVPADQVTLNLVCDFCSAPNPTWEYVGENVSRSNFRKGIDNFGSQWAGCDACDKLIRVQNVDALVDRIMASLPGDRQRILRDTAMVERVRKDLEDSHGRYVRSIVSRRRIGQIARHTSRIYPAIMPKVRDRLVRFWAGPVARRMVGGETNEPVVLPTADLGFGEGICEKVSHVGPEATEKFCRRQERVSQVAELFWVSREFSALAVTAGSKLPDLTVQRENMPASQGLVVFADPIREIRVPDGQLVHCMAIGWSLIPGGIWATLYCQPEQIFEDKEISVLREDFGWLLVTAPGAGIPWGTTPVEEMTPGIKAWGTLLATWFLMMQPGVAEVRTAEVDRGIRKSYGRAQRPLPAVRVVDLRRRVKAPQRAAEGAAEGSREYSVRWLVGAKTGGFWRDYWTGPGRAVRERRWISPYIAGPEGKPLKQPLDTVKVLR